MALHLVPYNNAMRLGQGFNSHTQEICIDNAVVGISDPEDSQAITPAPAFPIAHYSDSNSGSGAGTANNGTGAGNGTAAGGTTDKPKFTTVEKAPVDEMLDGLRTITRKYPSQIVTYYSKYVDKLSDVSNDLNVSGSLSIKYGEISGGGSGSFVNTDTFQSSDMNFLISVKVINQSIAIKDQLQFMNLSTHDSSIKSDVFTATYGDSFISGFQEGGSFNAIVSIKSLDSSKKMDIKANAHLALQVGVGSVEAQADVNVAKNELNKSSEVSITVNWSGGGQLKEGSEKWTIDTLQEVAVRFPDLVATCPQRTHAILTKYTALRGYLEWISKGESPLDYQIAELYTSELLDVYMGYKSIWKDIHTMMQAFDAGTIELIQSPGPLEPAIEPKKQKTDLDVVIKPYPPTFSGLDGALQKCRAFMVHIVKENDAITKDPNVAIDENRPTAYLRPQIFRQLLPMPPPIPALQFSIESWACTLRGIEITYWQFSLHYCRPTVLAVIGFGKTRLARSTRVSVSASCYRQGPKDYLPLYLRVELGTSFRDSGNGQSSNSLLTTFLAPVNSQGLQAGRWSSKTLPRPTSPGKANIVIRERVQFQYAYDSKPPTVIVFLSGFALDTQGPMNISVKADRVDASGFDIVLRALDTFYTADASWIAVPPDVKGIMCGSSDTPWAPGLSDQVPKPDLKVVGSVGDHVQFLAKTFTKAPQFLAWISGFSVSADEQKDFDLNLDLYDQARRGFNWQVSAGAEGADTKMTGAAISWLAFEQ